MNVMSPTSLKLDRRSFVVGSAAAGAGLALGFALPLGPDAARAADVIRAADGSPEIDAWVVIRPDDTVVIRIARSEMGQGTLTGLAQLVAEELDCDWSKVTTEFPTPGQNVARKRVWGDFSTGGSRGIRASQQYVREGGAHRAHHADCGRREGWNVPASECTAANSVITHTASGRKVGYGQMAEAAAKLDPPDVPLKNPKDWTIAGKPLKRLDTADKIVGKTVFGIDVRFPEMLYAAINACPVFGGKLQSIDETRISDMPGVKKVVKVGDNAVAVIADSWWRRARRWRHCRSSGTTATTPRSAAPRSRNSSRRVSTPIRLFVGNKAGDAKAALAGAAKVVEAVYSYPYQSHAPMEPMNATALYTSDRCEVWCPTQNGESALAATAEASGLPVGQCDVHKTFLGGGFGRRGQTDYVRQAVAVAKEVPGTHVKLLWTREEDTTHDFYHPITQCKMRAGFDADNNLIALHMRISGQSIFRHDPAVAAPERQGPGHLPGPAAGRQRGHVRLQHSEPADRSCDAQSVGAGRPWRGVIPTTTRSMSKPSSISSPTRSAKTRWRSV